MLFLCLCLYNFVRNHHTQVLGFLFVALETILHLVVFMSFPISRVFLICNIFLLDTEVPSFFILRVANPCFLTTKSLIFKKFLSFYTGLKSISLLSCSKVYPVILHIMVLAEIFFIHHLLLHIK